MTIERKNTFYIETFGCQMNVNDSEKVAGLLVAQGYEQATEPTMADFVFINTCAVREKAAEKLFHALGRLKKLKAMRPLVVGVGGCVAQLQGNTILERAPHVDLLVGTRNLSGVPGLLERARRGTRAVDLDRSADSFTIDPSLVAHTSSVRAYVTVMEGCNHVCSFCVVPRTRGPEVCRSPEEIVAEVASLVDRGFAEVTLLGQTVNAYRYGATDFAGLLARVDAVPGLCRLRFTTSHPSHLTPRVADALRDLRTVCPYLHLPVQSGSDCILKSMRRGYTRAEYLDKVQGLRQRVPDLALSTDVIVGYPGEASRDFEATVELVETGCFDGLFVFMYSPRPGTTAWREVDDVPDIEKHRRLQVLNQIQQRGQRERNKARVGQCENVLVDTVASDGRLSGRTPHFRIVHFDGPKELLGRLVSVRVVAAGPNSLIGALPATNSLTASSATPIL